MGSLGFGLELPLCWGQTGEMKPKLLLLELLWDQEPDKTRAHQYKNNFLVIGLLKTLLLGIILLLIVLLLVSSPQFPAQQAFYQIY